MILFVGLAGSGKTIQGRLLAQKIGAEYLSLGELLRQHVDPDIREKMLSGQLINDDDVIKLVDGLLPRENQTDQTFILDGFPRSLLQADWLISEIEKGRFKKEGVVHLKATPQTTTVRLMDRGRPDDNPEAINNRIDEYMQTILPIIEKLKNHGIPVYDINAEQSIEDVQREIVTELNINS